MNSVTPLGVPMSTMPQMPMNSPVSTTPGMLFSRVSQLSRFGNFTNRAINDEMAAVGDKGLPVLHPQHHLGIKLEMRESPLHFPGGGLGAKAV